MAKLTFDKLEGLGNDFVLLEGGSISGDQARQLCDRHLGIGADGVLLVLAPSSRGARARMLVLNADGSRPEMCGNGLRCVALWLALRDAAGAISYVVDTDAGPLLCQVEREGERALVQAELGRAEIFGEHRTSFEGRELDFLRVSTGNPHVVSFDAGLDLPAIDRLGPRISAEFPQGSNVELATQLGPRRFDLVVWERGVGRTLACGTGAAATAVAAATSGRAPFGEPIEVRLPGGALEIQVAKETLAVTARGPARRVFSGEVVSP
jgi:diaminopimelate epimerase